MLHQMMQSVAKSDRRLKAMTDLEVTLTAADKDAIVQGAMAKAAEAGFTPEQLKGLDLSVPDKCAPIANSDTFRSWAYFDDPSPRCLPYHCCAG